MAAPGSPLLFNPADRSAVISLEHALRQTNHWLFCYVRAVMSAVCIVGPCYPYRGGIAHHTALLGRAMAQRRDVHVVNFTRMYPEFLFPGKTQYDESTQELGFPATRVLDSVSPVTWRKSGQHIRQLAPERVVFQWWHPFFAPSFRALSAFIRKTDPDIAQTFICHNVTPHESNLAYKSLTRIGLSGADSFLLHSKAERPDLEPLAGQRPIAVHPHPTYDQFGNDSVTGDQARRDLDLSGEVLLFFGYVRAYKGLMTALEALPGVLARRPVTLVVAGEFYDKKSDYVDKVTELGIQEHVRFFDEYIPNEKVAQFFAAADLVVQPYVTATQSGISQLAFGFGKPIAATRVGGIPEAVLDGKTGLLVPPNAPEALSQAILRFFEDNLAETMHKNILNERERCSWGSLADALLEL